MVEGWLRVRALLNRWFGVALVACVLLAALGGWMAYGAYAAPGTHAEQQVVSRWSTTGSTSHRARVVNDTEVFAEDQVLRNRSVYYTKVTPVLNGTSHFGYRAEKGDLTATENVTLVVEGVETVGRNRQQTTLWRIEEPLARKRASLGPGETLAADYAVNVSKLVNRTDRIQRELGGGGQVQMYVRTNVTATGTVGGREVARDANWSLAIQPRGGTYQVHASGQPGGRYEQTRTVQVPNEPGPLRELGGPLLLVAGLAGAVALLWARNGGRLELDERERAALAYADDRSDFEEWLTHISLPDERLDGPEAEAESLADLVDYAIDADEGVIFDPGRNAYFVFHDGTRFVYRPPVEGTTGADVVGTDADSGEDATGANGTDEETEQAANGAAREGATTDDGASPTPEE